METAVKRLYEGMFLVDSAQAAADWEGTMSVIETILQRADAEVVAMRKWQERKLAYEIDHKTRGTYILTYFKADSQRIAGIEKDVLLSEKVMRVLVLGTEKRPESMLKRDISGEPEEKPAEATAKPAEAAQKPVEKPAEAPTSAPAPEGQPAADAPAPAAVAEVPAPVAEEAPAAEPPAEAPTPTPEVTEPEVAAEPPAEEGTAEEAEKVPE